MSRALAEFRLEHGVYRLGQFSPVSIRDQIVRATYLVEHLVASTELAESTRLLVVGAGAAGVVAAVMASRLGVRHVTLVERAGTVMPLQSQSQSRWLDPVQYDWPASHWRERSWPVPETPRRFTSVSAPFPALSAGIAEEWALDFQNRTSKVLSAGVKALFYTEVLPWTRTSSGLSVELKDVRNKAITVQDTDLIMLAAGFGIEDTTVPNTSLSSGAFKSIDFWSNDQFETPKMGITNNQYGVLVSGSGDGALQDFVRLSTGIRAARDILDAVWNTTVQTTPWKEQMSALWHWEDHASRARKFSPTPLDECNLLGRLHQRHVEAVQSLVVSNEWPNVLAWFNQRMSQRIIGSVKLALKCNHFNWCYGLNRIVALIVIEYVKSKGIDPVKTNVALKATSPVAHSCGAGCWGEVHVAHLAQGVSCANDVNSIKTWPAAQTQSENFDGLVIRHGIEPLIFGLRTFERLKPQVVPFHLP